MAKNQIKARCCGELFAYTPLDGPARSAECYHCGRVSALITKKDGSIEIFTTGRAKKVFVWERK